MKTFPEKLIVIICEQCHHQDIVEEESVIVCENCNHAMSSMQLRLLRFDYHGHPYCRDATKEELNAERERRNGGNGDHAVGIQS